jgi:hypothetical protein
LETKEEPFWHRVGTKNFVFAILRKFPEKSLANVRENLLPELCENDEKFRQNILAKFNKILNS